MHLINSKKERAKANNNLQEEFKTDILWDNNQKSFLFPIRSIKANKEVQ